jgi:putative endonuclease
VNGYLDILISESSERFYIGSTNDPRRRLAQHNANAVTATRGKGPWRRVSLLPFDTPTLARRAEAYLKRQKSRCAIEQVLAGTFHWPVALQPIR